MTETARINIRVIFALTLVHFTGDFYSAFISPLFPLFVDKLSLSLTQVGIIAGLARLLAFIVQPSVGYLADRYQTRTFFMVGLLMPVVFIPLTGLAGGFWSLLALVALGSIGSSMFHPSVTGMVPLYSGNRAGLAMSIFNTGGTLAFAVGPLFVTWYAARFGLQALPLTMVLGLMTAVYLFVVIPAPQSEGLQHLGFLGALKESLGSAWKMIVMIWLVMFLRALVGQSFMTFIPVMYVQKGMSVVAAGVVFSLFTVAGTVSGVLSGWLADRVGFKPIFLISHGLMVPTLLLLLWLDGHWVYLGAVAAGAVVLASLPLGVALAQRLAPKGRSMVASLMMGFAFGLGGMFAPLVGLMADRYGIQTVLTCMSFIPLLTLPLVARFPNTRNLQIETPA